MKKTLSQSTFPFAQLSIQKSTMLSPKTQKVQGFDKTISSNIYASKIEKIKNRPKQESLQQEYVKGLQDEIHYLEMELKLLKQKQIAKHSQVDQLQTFFGDGIPINQNILGMKNGFNNYKTQSEMQLKKMENQKNQRQALLVGLRKRTQELFQIITTQQQKYKKSLSVKSNQNNEIASKIAKIKKQIQRQQQSLRILKSQNRKLKQKINTQQRNKEIYSISKLKYETHKHSKLQKIRQTIKQKQDQLDKFEAEYQQLKKQEQEKSYVIMIEQENLKLKKKIIGAQKQFHSLEQKINDKKLELQQKLKQRQKQINSRVDMQNRLQNNKLDIQRQNGLSVQELQKVAKERQLKILQKIIEKNAKLSKYVEHYGSLLSKIQDNIQQLGQKRPELKREIVAYQNQTNVVQHQTLQQNCREYELCAALTNSSGKLEHYKDILPVVSDRIKRNNQKIKLKKTERQRFLQEIKPKQKQLQLIGILKSLNLEEVQICSSSNNNIQQVLIDLMRNWESLSRK